MSKRVKEEHDHHGYYIVAEPKSPWSRKIYAFHFHTDDNPDHEREALAIIRGNTDLDKYAVRGWRADTDDFTPMLPSRHQRRRIVWTCFSLGAFK
jgi:hypothetical protein